MWWSFSWPIRHSRRFGNACGGTRPWWTPWGCCARADPVDRLLEHGPMREAATTAPRNERAEHARSLQIGSLETDKALTALTRELSIAVDQGHAMQAAWTADLKRLQASLDAVRAERHALELALVRTQIDRDLLGQRLQSTEGEL